MNGGQAVDRRKEKKVKCVVWDLDNTLWEGTLLENDRVTPRQEALHVIRELDGRGILQSVASRNDHDLAMGKLREFGIEEYFLYPQINWGAKSDSIARIARSINIGVDTLAFIDDQPFEREEVGFSLPQVLCIDAARVKEVPDLPEMRPLFVTDDSRKRRLMYLSDMRRSRLEESFQGPKEEFLASLQMEFTIAPAREGDLKRAEELTVRTNQLNTTGYTYSYDELNAFRTSPRHRLYMAGLDDKYGTYGKIGLALVECDPEAWNLKLLLMSCRVMARGVGTILIHHIRGEARRNGVKLRSEMIPNDRNRMMYATYKFAGFKEADQNGKLVIFEDDGGDIPPFPQYVKVNTG